MDGATLRMIDPNVAFTAVRASRGKVVRAEPVAALYQQGRVHHIGTFPQLDRAAAGYSPDRVDAVVWAFSELLVEPMKSEGILSCTAGTQRPPSSAINRTQPNHMGDRLHGMASRAEEIRFVTTGEPLEGVVLRPAS